jgi:hypothetical protein
MTLDGSSSAEGVAELGPNPSGQDRSGGSKPNGGFRLPMASAVLTVLYPDAFTVYDYRACDVIGGFHHIADRAKPESVWNGYIEFMDAVKKAAPLHLSLRDKDRYLWARAFAEQLQSDIERCFGARSEDDG